MGKLMLVLRTPGSAQVSCAHCRGCACEVYLNRLAVAEHGVKAAPPTCSHPFPSEQHFGKSHPPFSDQLLRSTGFGC